MPLPCRCEIFRQLISCRGISYRQLIANMLYGLAITRHHDVHLRNASGLTEDPTETWCIHRLYWHPDPVRPHVIDSSAACGLSLPYRIGLAQKSIVPVSAGDKSWTLESPSVALGMWSSLQVSTDHLLIMSIPASKRAIHSNDEVQGRLIFSEPGWRHESWNITLSLSGNYVAAVFASPCFSLSTCHLSNSSALPKSLILQ